MNRNKKSTVFIAICLIVALASGVVSSASILKYHGTTKEVKNNLHCFSINKPETAKHFWKHVSNANLSNR